jgi:hypothetical protein
MELSLLDRVFTPGMERMTLQEPNQGKPEAMQRPVPGNRLRRILRARWVEATIWPEQWGNHHSVALNEPQTQALHITIHLLCYDEEGACAPAKISTHWSGLPSTAGERPVWEKREALGPVPSPGTILWPSLGTPVLLDYAERRFQIAFRR